VKFKPNVDALKALVKKEGLDALICLSPENFAYVSGVFILTVALIRPRQAFAVVPAKGDPFLVICSIEKSLADSEGWIGDVRIYTEFADNPIDALVAALKDKGLDKAKTFGIDLDYLPVSSHERLTKHLPNVKLANTTEHVARIRAIKTKDEVAWLEKITKQTHRATLDAMAASKIGDTERMMADRIATNIINYGADGTLFMCFASGDRTPQAHAHATSRVPKEGEILRFDVGGTYGQWASDFARTYSIGKPSAMQREVHRKLCEAQEATINAVKPGVLAEDLFFICRDEFKKHGLPFHMPHIGHSFGIELHENPMFRPGDKTKLAAGMVLNIEPAVFDEERNCYHTEDLVVVTDTGHRLLTLGLAPKDLPVIGHKFV
jgi:Xaa-Pro aminopeptidase